MTKATEAKAARRASPRATSSTPRAPVAEATSSSEATPAGAKELRRHHAIRVGRSAEDADETNRHREQNETTGGEQKISHGRAPG